MTRMVLISQTWPLFCFLGLAFGACGAAPAAALRPNIVLIVADDLGYGELGCYGQKWIKTPRLDALAQQGMRFTQFYSGAPVCAPSRCVLMTGKHAGHAPIRDNRRPFGLDTRWKDRWQFPGQQPLPADEVTIATVLQARGYSAAAIGKWGLGQVGTTGDPCSHGFDLFYGYYCQVHAHNHYPKFLWRNARQELLPGNNATQTGQTYAQDMFTEEALKFIREHQNEPFFLYLPLIIPHASIQVPEPALDQYQGKIPESPYEHEGGYFPHHAPHAGYASMVSYLDRDIGRVVDLIDELGLSNNTLILFTSDNGPTHGRTGGADSDFFQSSGPLRGRKGSLFEGGIRVPLIARWTGRIAPHRQSDHLAAFYDMLPTLCDIAHAELPPNVDGISFTPTLLGNANQTSHEYLYWEFPGYEVQQAIRVGRWKAVRSAIDQADTRFELYDLTNDVGETQNVADQHPEVIDRMTEIAHEAHVPSKRFPLLQEERTRK